MQANTQVSVVTRIHTHTFAKRRKKRIYVNRKREREWRVGKCSHSVAQAQRSTCKWHGTSFHPVCSHKCVCVFVCIGCQFGSVLFYRIGEWTRCDRMVWVVNIHTTNVLHTTRCRRSVARARTSCSGRIYGCRCCIILPSNVNFDRNERIISIRDGCDNGSARARARALHIGAILLLLCSMVMGFCEALELIIFVQ